MSSACGCVLFYNRVGLQCAVVQLIVHMSSKTLMTNLTADKQYCKLISNQDTVGSAEMRLRCREASREAGKRM
jgi:hypothetical protein